MKLDDLTGKRFGRLTVVKKHDDPTKKYTLWECKCDCGNTKIARASLLKAGRTKSCGCYLPEHNYAMNTTHGWSKTHLYAVWNSMKGRCYNCNNHNYKRYGERGITVCEEWKNSFETFRDWAISSGYKNGYSIDRINNDGNYCPQNCRWTDVKTQNNNRRVSLMFTHNGKTQNLSSWCEELNIPYLRTWERIMHYGYTFEQAISLPKNKSHYKKE